MDEQYVLVSLLISNQIVYQQNNVLQVNYCFNKYKYKGVIFKQQSYNRKIKYNTI